jgi:hypothetical protein
LKRGEELYQLYLYAACCTAKLCRNQTSDLDVTRLLIQPILFSIHSSAPTSTGNLLQDLPRLPKYRESTERFI